MRYLGMTYNNPIMQKKQRDNKRLSNEDKQIEDLMYRYMKNTDKEAIFRILTH